MQNKHELENDGGPQQLPGAHGNLQTDNAPFALPHQTEVELAHLHHRLIALENVVIALLADAPDRQLVLAHAIAAYITPRTGRTQHPSTVHAAALIRQLLTRAGHVRCAQTCT